MSQQLHQALVNILSMPYFRNEQARSGGANYGHEEAVAEKIRQAGFTEFKRDSFKKLKKTILKKWAESGDDTDLKEATTTLTLGSFILQPAGSQNFPDILILDFDTRYIALECKSGQDGLCPMWNDNLPKQNAIYVLSSGIKNSTTCFLGRDVITANMVESQTKMVDELKEVVLKYKSINSSLDVFNRGWDTKFRPQNFQSGGKDKTNYFEHQDRSKCEQRALEYALCQTIN